MASGESELAAFKTKTDLAYLTLRRAILSGELPPGERLNLDAAARQFGISKIPLREAVQRLRAQGLVVQPSSHSSAFVASLSLRELRGIFSIRGALESLAAKLAAERITGTELEILTDLHQQMERRFADQTLEPMSDLNRQFHSSIASATQITTLVELTDLTLLRIRHYRLGMQRVRHDWGNVLVEHAEILAALRDHDPGRAERAARCHVDNQTVIELGSAIDPELIDIDTDDARDASS